MKKRIFDDFDTYANDYRNIHNDNIKISGADSYYFAEMKVEKLTKFEKNIPLKILDIGCGDGTTALFFSKYFSRWQIFGIDISAQSIAEASHKNISNCIFKTYDGLHVPFDDASVDIVFIAGVLHHVAFHLHNPILAEINRVLKSQGRFYLYEHNPFNPLTRYLVNTCIFDKDAKLLNHIYTKKIIKNNQFDILQIAFIIFFPRKTLLKNFIAVEKYLEWLPLGGQYFIRAVRS